mmetsp:Transcript_60036/g.123277  ORF Transcript_60036/g.123277 Transcript_60036/m.123277 type:complete len:101 (+) Transcript_60036:319-621(+)
MKSKLCCRMLSILSIRSSVSRERFIACEWTALSPLRSLACEDDDEISRQDLRFCLTLGVKSSSQQKFLLLSKTPTSFPTHTWLQRQHGSIRIREPGCYCH